MIYRIGKHTIKSHNAAKPPSQASQYLIKVIAEQLEIGDALDFGCGKLRYSNTLAGICSNLTLVDSNIQISRNQKIDGVTTTVKDHAIETIKDAHIQILTIEEFRDTKALFDFILCANVLSAIPALSVRKETVSLLSQRLNSGGKCLFVSMYSNSYFDIVSKSPKSSPHLDGWIRANWRGSYFYGLIDAVQLSTLVIENGFSTAKSWSRDGSAYCFASTD